MRYFKAINGNHIATVGEGMIGTEITEEEYAELLSIFRSIPQEDGYDFLLRNDDLTWDRVELPPFEEEISDGELLEILLGGAE